MDSLNFYDQYGTNYPALFNSIFSRLIFSDYTLSGDAFTGKLQISNTDNLALSTIGTLIGSDAINVTGSVIDSGDTLTIELSSTDGEFLQAFSDPNVLPVLNTKVTAD